jgi:hypothetical protein
VTVEWGDGFTQTYDLVAGVVDFETAYSYAAAGVYSATVTVVDYDGGLDSVTFAVTVAESQFYIYLPVIYK